MSRDDSGSNVVFLILGAAVGAAAALLLAPKSGKETREQLADWLDERRERSTELLHKLKEALPEKKDQIAAAIRAGKEAYAAKNGHGEHS